MGDHSEYHTDVWPIKLKHFPEKYNHRLTILEINTAEEMYDYLIWLSNQWNYNEHGQKKKDWKEVIQNSNSVTHLWNVDFQFIFSYVFD